MKWFRNLKIGVKLVIGFSIAIVLLGAVGLMGVAGAGKIHKDLQEALTVRLPALDCLLESDRDLQQLLVAERSMIFSNTQSEIFKALVAEYEENLKQSQERLGRYEALPLKDEEKAILEQYKKDRNEWEALSRQIVKGRQEDTREGRRLAIDLSLEQAKTAFEKMRNHLDMLQEINLNLAEESRKEADVVYMNTLLYVLVLTGAAILVVFIVLVLLNRTITRPIKGMVARGHELVEGEADLTKRLSVDSKDEVGRLAGLFDRFLQRIQGIIAEVKESSTSMLNSINEISSGSQELASRTNQQAASVTETSTTLEEFTSIVKQNSDNSVEANSRITAFDKDVQDKRDLIRNVTATMTEIDKSSKQIGNIMNVINDISFQTNLLALNAAVEAARAGEAGRGFAVVASEVRNLAQKTAESSKTIQEIVTTNVNSTEKGMELVRETETFFESIMNMLSELSGIIRDIENSSREQFTGMEQISQAVMQLDQVINQNAELVEQFADTGKRMDRNAKQLHTLMEQFKTENGGQIPVKDTAVKETGKKTQKKTKMKNREKAEKPEPRKKVDKEPAQADDFFAGDEEEFEEF